MGKRMRNKNRNLQFANEEGSALVIALLCLLVLGVTSSAIVFTTQGEMKSSSAYKYSQQAFYVANGGVQRAVSWYNSSYIPHLPSSDYNTTYFPVKYSGNNVLLAGDTGGSAVYPDSAVASSFHTAFASRTLEADTKNSGIYDLNASLIKYQPTTFLNPTTFATYPSAIERWRITSTGYWRTSANPIGEAQITATIENDGCSIFDRALWGIDGVSLGGTNMIDSYDPRLGPYGGTNKGYLGSIASNGTVSINGNVEVDGSLAYGPSGSFVQTGGSSTITGDVIHLPSPHYFAPIPNFTVGTTNFSVAGKATSHIPAGSYATVSAKSQSTLIFDGGVYYIDTLEELAQAQIHIAAPSTIFIKTTLNLNGQSIMNDMGLPEDLNIFYSGTNPVTLEGGTGFYGTVYAPNASMTLKGTTDFFGSFIGKTVNDNGTPRVHFDQGSLNRNLIPQPFRVITWSQNVY
jgi:hypothetical protein